MNLSTAIPMALHQLAGTVWVGGLFFSLVVLRSALKSMSDAGPRIRLAITILRSFFPWVWVAIAILWVSGMWLGLVGGGNRLSPHVLVMIAIAFVMTLIFAWIVAFPFRQMVRIATGYENWGWAGAKFATIRRLMAVNLVLGAINLIVGSTGAMVLALLNGAPRG